MVDAGKVEIAKINYTLIVKVGINRAPKLRII